MLKQLILYGMNSGKWHVELKAGTSNPVSTKTKNGKSGKIPRTICLNAILNATYHKHEFQESRLLVKQNYLGPHHGASRKTIPVFFRVYASNHGNASNSDS